MQVIYTDLSLQTETGNSNIFNAMTKKPGAVEANLNVAAAHVVFVAFQSQISVFWVDKTN